MRTSQPAGTSGVTLEYSTSPCWNLAGALTNVAMAALANLDDSPDNESIVFCCLYIEGQTSAGVFNLLLRYHQPAPIVTSQNLRFDQFYLTWSVHMAFPEHCPQFQTNWEGIQAGNCTNVSLW
ncbi:hypothetical protein FRB93_007499 [Tulasnella sp. JGI-2019a]|nr:hypothetical protein FRB93_007499 [Tulasnella sp. JGI-2019a]